MPHRCSLTRRPVNFDRFFSTTRDKQGRQALSTNVDTRFFRLHSRVRLSFLERLAQGRIVQSRNPIRRHAARSLLRFLESSRLDRNRRTISMPNLREPLTLHSRRCMIDSGIRPRFKSDYRVDPIRRVRDPREGGLGRRRRRRDRARDQLALKIRISM